MRGKNKNSKSFDVRRENGAGEGETVKGNVRKLEYGEAAMLYFVFEGEITRKKAIYPLLYRDSLYVSRTFCHFNHTNPSLRAGSAIRSGELANLFWVSSRNALVLCLRF